MTRGNIFISMLLAVTLLAVQVIAVGAAPASQETTPITGTVESIVLETDTNTGTTTVLVTLTDEMNVTQTVRLSLEDAAALGLVVDDGTGNQTPDESVIGTTVDIDPTMVIQDETTDTTEEPQHPVGSALSDFFSELLGVDYETIMEVHDNGAGFGVIAQALWMTNALGGDSDTFAAIMEAKQTKNYEGITLPDGSTPQNWGQFRKAVMSDREKSKENLGAIMSGRAAENQQNDTQLTSPSNNGNAPDNGNGKNKDKGKNKNKGNNKNKNKNK
jgi:hypothetical protein